MALGFELQGNFVGRWAVLSRDKATEEQAEDEGEKGTHGAKFPKKIFFSIAPF